MLIGMVFMIIWEMFHGRIFLNLVLLLLLVNFVSGFMLEVMYISFIVRYQSPSSFPETPTPRLNPPFMIIWEMFFCGASAATFRLELMYISFINCAVATIHRNHFFHFYQQNESSESKVKPRQASNRYKRVLEAAKLAYANKTKDSITSQKLGSRDL